MTTKSKSLKYAVWHALGRAGERYGRCSRRVNENLCANIRGDRNVVRLSDTGQRTRFACYFREEWYLLVYDWRNGKIVTFLPYDALTYQEKRLLSKSPVYRKIDVDSFEVFNLDTTCYCLGKTDEQWGVRLEIPMPSKRKS